MKTNVNISNLKKVALTFCSALVLTAGSFTQANPDVYVNDKMVAAARIEARMIATEHAIRFVAPSVDEVTVEMERLNALAVSTEVSLKYVAPAAEVAPELERLDILAGITETALQYVAPAAEVAPELERLDILAGITETALQYVAPAAADEEFVTPILDRLEMMADKNN